MKKSYLFSAFAAGMVMLSACSSDNDLTGGNAGNESNDAVQQIVLQVANTGEGMQTRAGRPLLSSEAKQTIENVKVIICKKDDSNVLFVKNISDWQTNSTEYKGGAHGRKTTFQLTGDDKLDPGSYTIYAIGYHTTSDYENLSTAIKNIAKGSTFNANTILNIQNVKGEEIFAGWVENFTVEANKGFDQPVVLNRQVAGTFGYFDNIPYVDGAAKLQLVASNGNTSLVLGGFNSSDLTGNGTGKGTNVNYVVNGTKAATKNVVYTINLTDWFGPIEDKNTDGLIDATNWKMPTGKGYESYAKAKFQNGSVFGGTFLIPFAKVDSKKTFVLQLTDNDDKVLKQWTVKLPSGDGQLSEYSLSYWNSTATAPAFASKNVTDELDKYSVVRNHLYGIGVRSKDNPNPGGGSTDPDEPEPLNKKQELTLRVNDNWEVIHKMELE